MYIFLFSNLPRVFEYMQCYWPLRLPEYIWCLISCINNPGRVFEYTACLNSLHLRIIDNLHGKLLMTKINMLFQKLDEIDNVVMKGSRRNSSGKKLPPVGFDHTTQPLWYRVGARILNLLQLMHQLTSEGHNYHIQKFLIEFYRIYRIYRKFVEKWNSILQILQILLKAIRKTSIVNLGYIVKFLLFLFY